MKKLITTALLTISLMVNAQNYSNSWSKRDKINNIFITFGFDARNLVEGSKPTNYDSELDFRIKAGTTVQNLEIAIFYENFKRITYQSYGFNVGYVLPLNLEINALGLSIPLNKTDLYAGIEGGSIIRQSNSNFYNFGFNGEIRQHIGKRFIVSAQYNSIWRPDNDKKDGGLKFTNSIYLNGTIEIFN